VKQIKIMSNDNDNAFLHRGCFKLWCMRTSIGVVRPSVTSSTLESFSTELRLRFTFSIERLCQSLQNTSSCTQTRKLIIIIIIINSIYIAPLSPEIQRTGGGRDGLENKRWISKCLNEQICQSWTSTNNTVAAENSNITYRQVWTLKQADHDVKRITNNGHISVMRRQIIWAITQY